jgi:hypothetical protein
MAHFLKKPFMPTKAEDLADPEKADSSLREEMLKIFLCLRDVHVVHGGGASTLAHTDAQVEKTLAAYAEAAALFKKSLFS